jgi:hypothetical protein
MLQNDTNPQTQCGKLLTTAWQTACNCSALTQKHGEHSALLADCCHQHRPANEASVVCCQQEAVQAQLQDVAVLPPQLVHNKACKVYDEHPKDKHTQPPAQPHDGTAALSAPNMMKRRRVAELVRLFMAQASTVLVKIATCVHALHRIMPMRRKLQHAEAETQSKDLALLTSRLGHLAGLSSLPGGV